MKATHTHKFNQANAQLGNHLHVRTGLAGMYRSRMNRHLRAVERQLPRVRIQRFKGVYQDGSTR